MTAFAAHAVAANLGGYAQQHQASLVELGGLLALYDGAEIVLKPVFGALADRVGARIVLLGGLLGFALASLAFVAAGNPGLLALARLAQGISAAAFSPATGTLVAVHGSGRRGRAFGSYGATKSLGYLLGPILGGTIVAARGYEMLFAVLAVVALLVAAAVVAMVPASRTAPRQRESVVILARGLVRSDFLGPVGVLAGSTAALSAGVGFLPVLGLRGHLSTVVTGALVSLLAASSIGAQLGAGRALDRSRLPMRAGLAIGLGAAAGGFLVAASAPGTAGLAAAAVIIGVGVGISTPLGFAALAGVAPSGRMGTTMGAAKMGRELGDAGGPLLVGALAAVSLSAGFVGLAGVLAVLGIAVIGRRR